MEDQHMIIYIPYTYLIGWSKYNIWYYGVRYAKGCQPSDLWTSYFTSSKLVKKARSEYGEPDIIQIRKTFTNENNARIWETKVLRRLKVVLREDFINQTDNIAISIQSASVPKPGTSTAMIGNHNASGNKGKKQSKDHIIKRTSKLKGRIFSQETIEKMRLAKIGKKQSIESNLKRSKALTGKKRGPYKKKD